MENFSPGSERNLLEMKVAITWKKLQPGLKILAWFQITGLGFSARPNGLKNTQKVHVIEMKFQPGLKKEREHAHQLCFRISVNFLTQICVLCPG